jgi:two-component system chemotaxis response regulator CheB
MMSKPIRTLIVDDSALVRKAVTEILARDPEIEVVGTAVDPYVARDRILALSPDVITLDIEMPRMDGLTFLKLLMKHRPMPVVIMSSLTPAGSDKALEALQAGAVEVIAKPGGPLSIDEAGPRLAQTIKAAARARPRLPAAIDSTATVTPWRQNAALTPNGSRRYSPKQLILIGASTGGTEALKKILTSLAPDLPGICIVQHIPGHFSQALANRLNDLSSLHVREARAGDRIEEGLALLAPGGHHLVLRWTGAFYAVELNEGPPGSVSTASGRSPFRFRPALRGRTPFPRPVAYRNGGRRRRALLKLRQDGAQTIAQDEASCVVFGMPREAIRLGAAQHVVSLREMPHFIERWSSRAALSPRS